MHRCHLKSYFHDRKKKLKIEETLPIKVVSPLDPFRVAEPQPWEGGSSKASPRAAGISPRPKRCVSTLKSFCSFLIAVFFFFFFFFKIRIKKEYPWILLAIFPPIWKKKRKKTKPDLRSCFFWNFFFY